MFIQKNLKLITLKMLIPCLRKLALMIIKSNAFGIDLQELRLLKWRGKIQTH